MNDLAMNNIAHYSTKIMSHPFYKVFVLSAIFFPETIIELSRTVDGFD